MRRFLALPILFSLLILATLAQATGPRPGGLPAGVGPGEIAVRTLDGQAPAEPLRLPLTHTDVRIDISGFVARTTVTQRYENPFEAPIEAVYVFPLPNQAAVDGMSMRIGDKLIRGIIKERDEARRTYEQAKAAGKRTGLLEQERPNIFTQSIGNIMPGDEIEIEISYVDILHYRDEGAFELVFPMVVGPRYTPDPGVDQSQPQIADANRVADASRITPPVLEPDQRSGHDIMLEVNLDAALPIHGVHSISHAVDIEEVSASERKVRLHPSDTIPNKDFVLRYQVAGEAPEATLISHRGSDGDGYFTLIVLPQRDVDDSATVPRDLIFILDTSGSMRGFPLDKSKQAMERLIDGMRPDDRFNLVRFAGSTGTLWPEPRPKSVANVAEARRFLAGLRGAGGTEMRRGIVEALSQPSDPERLRIAFLLTDGYVGNEDGILRAIEQERRGARIFTLGVGSSVNRYLLDRAADIGRGESFYLRQDENADATIERFFKRVDRPNLAHVEIDWDQLAVSDLTPARVPDLWAGQPIEVHGRYRQPGEGGIEISGRLGAETYTLPLKVELPARADENAVLANVWARARVKELMLDRARGGDDERIEREVTRLGLEYGIMTQWTSFVAVEEKVVNQGGEMQTVQQPLELPEGVDYEGVFGADGGVMAERLAAPSPQLSYPSVLTKSLLTGSAMAPPPPTAPATAKGVNLDTERADATEPERQRHNAAKQSATPKCRRIAMAVSGGLKYAHVDKTLREGWTDLCKDLDDRVTAQTTVRIRLTVGADGSVSRIQLRDEEKLPKTLVEALRHRFGALRFGPVAAPGSAGITIELRIG